MSSSPDLVESLKMFSLEPGMIELALDLVINGRSSGSKHKPHSIKDANLLYVEVIPPSRNGTKGTAKFIDPNRSDLPGIELNPAMLQYPVKTYMGKKIYIHPDHQAIINEVRSRIYKKGKITAGVLILKNKGIISFVV